MNFHTTDDDDDDTNSSAPFAHSLRRACVSAPRTLLDRAIVQRCASGD